MLAPLRAIGTPPIFLLFPSEKLLCFPKVFELFVSRSHWFFGPAAVASR
jgi:hypothetical protein